MTSFLRSLGLVVSGLVLTAFPTVVSAQTCGLNMCGTGTLFVYVQVINGYTNTTVSPSNFTVQVSGQNVSLPSFPGSQSGTTLSLGGGSGYSVIIPQTLSGYVPSYSQGCNGTLYANQQATCVITMSGNTLGFYPVQPYPYPYTPSILSCTPAYQTVAAGQTATFTAQGSTAPYNWTTNDRSYLSAGPVLNVALQTAGIQTVTVTSGSQTGNCTVNVTAAINAPIIFPGTPGYVPTLQTNYIP